MKAVTGGIIGAGLGFAASYLMRSGLLAFAGPSDWFSANALRVETVRNTMAISTAIGAVLGIVIGAAFQSRSNRGADR